MKNHPMIIGFFVAMVFLQFAHDANPSVWSYYTMLKFDWSPRMVGYSLGAFGIGIAYVQGSLIRQVIPKFGEKRVIWLKL